MAIGITVLNNQTIESGDESVAFSSIEWASDTGGTVLNAGSGERFISVNVQVSITFNGSATGDAIIHARKSADNATTEDTEDVSTAVKTVECSQGNEVTVTIPFYDFDYLDIGVENEDETYTLTYNAIWEGIKYTGLATS